MGKIKNVLLHMSPQNKTKLFHHFFPSLFGFDLYLQYQALEIKISKISCFSALPSAIMIPTMILEYDLEIKKHTPIETIEGKIDLDLE